MKKQILALVLVALCVAGCATKFARSETVTPYGESVTEHRTTEYGDTVDVTKTTTTAPVMPGYGGMPYGGGYGYGPSGIPFLQPASLGEQAMGQIPSGTTYVVPMPVQQPSLPAQASDTTVEDLAIIAEHQLRLQRELDALKKNK
jgi:hypothetical protein